MDTMQFDVECDFVNEGMGITQERDRELRLEVLEFVTARGFFVRPLEAIQHIIDHVGETDAEKVYMIYAYGFFRGTNAKEESEEDGN